MTEAEARTLKRGELVQLKSLPPDPGLGVVNKIEGNTIWIDWDSGETGLLSLDGSTIGHVGNLERAP